MPQADCPSTLPHTWYRDRWRPVSTANDPEVRLSQLPEAFVQDIWRSCHFDTQALTTFDGNPVRVRDPGRLNRDGGPDFLNARLKIGEIEWIGDVEIHLASEDWYRHGHQRDPRYNSVVLHVTLVADLWTGNIVREDGTTAPEVVLGDHLNTTLRTLLHRFRTRDTSPLVCSNEWPAIPEEIRMRAIRRMARLRLLRRGKQITIRLASGADVREELYQRIFACLGYAKNELPMCDLARRIPISAAHHLASRPDAEALDVEALFMGIAGLIPGGGAEPEDPESRSRVRELARRFEERSTRLASAPMARAQWQFFRLRPSNFPPLRIAQGCALITSGILSPESPFVRGDSLDASDPTELLAQLTRLLSPPVDPFWSTHYRLERSSRPHSASLGADRILRIIVNAVLPVIVAQSERDERAAVVQQCTRFLEELPSEDDEVTRIFSDLGTHLASARESQGIHELYSLRCTNHGCLRCDVGRHILRSSRISRSSHILGSSEDR